MALSYYEYTADGVQVNYASKQYVEEAHLVVSLDGIPQLSSVYTVSGTTVTFNNPPPSGSRIRIGRNSNQDYRLTDYEDAALLTADIMDADAKQLFYMAQEAIDTASETNLGASTFYNASVNPPENPKIGDLWYDTFNKFLKIYNGETWELATPSNETFTFTNPDFITDSIYTYVGVAGLNEDVFVFLNGVKLIRAASLVGLATEDYFLDLDDGRIYFQLLSSTDVVQVVLAASDIGAYNKTNVEDFIATEGQTIFNLTKSYVPTTDTLHVYVNGIRQSSYIESSSVQVTFNHGLSAGDEVTFISNQYLSSQSQGTTAAEDVTFTPTGGAPTTVDAHLNLVDTRLTTLETSTTSSTAISGLDTRVSTLETDPTTGTAVSAIDTRVSTLETDPTTGTAVSAIDTRVSTLETDPTTGTAVSAIDTLSLIHISEPTRPY